MNLNNLERAKLPGTFGENSGLKLQTECSPCTAGKYCKDPVRYYNEMYNAMYNKMYTEMYNEMYNEMYTISGVM